MLARQDGASPASLLGGSCGSGYFIRPLSNYTSYMLCGDTRTYNKCLQSTVVSLMLHYDIDAALLVRRLNDRQSGER